MRGYFTTKLSDHLEETPEGALIARDCVIARTGFQTYKISDLPQQAAVDMGVDMSNPNADIDLYRPPEEVFHPDTLRSAEGKAVTDNHPPDFIDPQNFTEYARGHLQNVRKGKEPLDSGDWPMIADIIIAAEPLLSKVKSKQARELSLGYDYGIARDGQRINQTDMVINHLAVVPKGRAGPEARIMDSAPEAVAEPPAVVDPPTPSAVERAATSSTSTAVPTQKEKKPVAITLKHLLGLGLKAFAVNAEPEEVATAVEAINQSPSASNRARANDEGEPESLAELDKAKQRDKAKDSRAKDARAKDRRAKDDLGDEPDEDVEPPAVDEKRVKMHDALDAMMDKRGKDADMNELRALLDEFMGEEADEPEHADDGPADISELENVVGEETDDEAPCEECGEVGDACQCEPGEDAVGEPGEEVVESGEEELEPAGDGRARDGKAKDRGRARDAAAGAMATLKVLRPLIARTNDKALIGTFNASLAAVSRSSRASSGSHGKFVSAANARSEAPRGDSRSRATDADPVAARNARLQTAYNDALGGVKSKGGK